MASGVEVHGLRNLNRALRVASKDVRAGFRAEYRHVAEPVRQDAEVLARSSIRNLGVPWSQMRIGITQRAVYVVPKQRGVKGRGRQQRRRENLARLLYPPMQKALDRNAAEVERRFNRMLEGVADKFNR